MLNNETVGHNFGEDFLVAEHVVAIAESTHLNIVGTVVEVSRHHLINGITGDGVVLGLLGALSLHLGLILLVLLLP